MSVSEIPNEIMEKQCCEDCGQDSDILFNYYKRRKLDGTPLWVCDVCFKDLMGVSFQDLAVERVADED
jgi:ribosomal protein L37AE/L43A